MTRSVKFWAVAVLLGMIALGGSFMWYRSYAVSEQAVVRAWFPGVTVLTTDRGRLGVLSLGEQPTVSRWVFRWRTNERPAEEAPTLDRLCADHGLGFGVDQAVAIAGAERPAVAGVNPDGMSWAPRRVVVPFWAIVAASLGLLLVWSLTVGVRQFRLEHGLCRKCSFDVSGCSHFCPKCGRAIPKKTWSGETRPRRRVAAAG